MKVLGEIKTPILLTSDRAHRIGGSVTAEYPLA